MSYSARLTGEAAADYVYHNVVLSGYAEEFERLTHDEFKGVEPEIFVEALFVYGYGSVACGQQTNAGDRFFTSARSPVLNFLFSSCFCHDSTSLIEFERFGLLSLMIVIGPLVNLELGKHLSSERIFRKHALNRFVNRNVGLGSH